MDRKNVAMWSAWSLKCKGDGNFYIFEWWLSGNYGYAIVILVLLIVAQQFHLFFFLLHLICLQGDSFMVPSLPCLALSFLIMFLTPVHIWEAGKPSVAVFLPHRPASLLWCVPLPYHYSDLSPPLLPMFETIALMLHPFL